MPIPVHLPKDRSGHIFEETELFATDPSSGVFEEIERR